jgi:hypothetical protein
MNIHGQEVSLLWVEPEPEGFEAYPELDDSAAVLSAYLPIADAALGPGRHLCILAAIEPPHAVYLFERGLHLIAPSIEAFGKSLAGH